MRNFINGILTTMSTLTTRWCRRRQRAIMFVKCSVLCRKWKVDVTDKPTYHVVFWKHTQFIITIFCVLFLVLDWKYIFKKVIWHHCWSLTFSTAPSICGKNFAKLTKPHETSLPTIFFKLYASLFVCNQSQLTGKRCLSKSTKGKANGWQTRRYRTKVGI